MSKDTIYRQEAIDGISGLMAVPLKRKRGASTSEQTVDQITNSIWNTAISCVKSYLRNMPPAEPKILACGEGELNVPSWKAERKKGEWIRNDNGTYSCSICQSWIPEEQHHYARYCLYCGAEMKGETK